MLRDVRWPALLHTARRGYDRVGAKAIFPTFYFPKRSYLGQTFPLKIIHSEDKMVPNMKHDATKHYFYFIHTKHSVNYKTAQLLSVLISPYLDLKVNTILAHFPLFKTKLLLKHNTIHKG